MNKQMANLGRRLSVADMKKLEGGAGGVGSGGTGGFRCGPPPPPGKCITTYVPGGANCCKCCVGATACEADRDLDPACWLV